MYRIENRTSGAYLGEYPGEDADAAIRAMLVDAGCPDAPADDIRAVQVGVQEEPEPEYPQYLKVCPRGFSDEYTVFRVESEAEACEFHDEYSHLDDSGEGYTCIAPKHQRYRAVSWADRWW
jgi:hypothetical protein